MNSKNLKTILNKASKVINRSNTLPVIDNIKFQGGALTVTNLETTYTYHDKEFDGLECLVDFSQLKKIAIKLKPQEISFQSLEGKFLIVTTKGVLKLPSLEIDDFPTFKAPDLKQGRIEAKHLPDIKKSLNYLGTDDLRPVMTYTLIDQLGYIVASDAHKLCYYKHESFTVENILLSTQAVKILDFECDIFKENDMLFLRGENESLLINGQNQNYPNWEAIIPRKNDKMMRVNSLDLLERLELALITGNQHSELVRFDLINNELQVSSKDMDFDTSYSDFLEVEYIDENFSIGIKNKLLREIIKTEKTEFLTFLFSDSSRGFLINENILLMPMVLND